MVADCGDGVVERSRTAEVNHIVIVPVRGVHPGAVAALDYARSVGDDVRAVYVEIDGESTETVLMNWGQQATETPLMVLESPRSSVMEPLVAYIDALERGTNGARVTVVLPELVTTRVWARLLPSPLELALKGALLSRDRVAITSVRRVPRPLLEARPEPREAAGQLATR
jgi:hypothetical protein